MCYSNPKVQIEAIEDGAMQKLIRMLSTETSLPLRNHVLTAVSALVRHFPFAQRKFLDLGGFQALSNILTQHDGDAEKLWIKSLTLVNDLLTEHVSTLLQNDEYKQQWTAAILSHNCYMLSFCNRHCYLF